MTTVIIEQENTQMINDLYRLLKKYSGLRNLIRNLKVKYLCNCFKWKVIYTFVFVAQTEYGDSKLYPIIPRYSMLKDMIKDIMHNPDYMEVCHEVDNWN